MSKVTCNQRWNSSKFINCVHSNYNKVSFNADNTPVSTPSHKGIASQPTPPLTKQQRKRPYLPQASTSGTTNPEPTKRKTKN
ncbi:hypothetical protein L1987_55816 [Smallanthus sonchifolius]|uniref:Uncharacterized protein n=1 Tax=Smallanthus sonchifolius TaxID=185202 RepID=A0ACB9EAQ1_9ASTR|nr:hypothetical protein L1987_55816 [Smallanthus sonchifolius]